MILTKSAKGIAQINNSILKQLQEKHTEDREKISCTTVEEEEIEDENHQQMRQNKVQKNIHGSLMRF